MGKDDNCIIYENNAELSYEVNSLAKKVANSLFFYPVLNHLPKRSQSGVKKSHKMAEEVIDNRTSHKALEVLYTGGRKEHTRTLAQYIAQKVWMGTDNVKGVRNRLKITERELSLRTEYFIQERGVTQLRMLSIAAGSARSFLEVLERAHKTSGIHTHVVFLDKSQSALEYSKKLFEPLQSDKERYSFEWVEGTANGYLNGLHVNDCFHVIEMVGLMDYFDDEQARRTMSAIYDHLEPGGCLVTANIMPNREQSFITRVVDWKMVYRNPTEFIKLVESAKFGSNAVKVFVEPLRVHMVVRATKQEDV